MPYCTLEDILGQMDEADVIAYTDDDDAGVVDETRTDQAMDQAAGIIDAYIMGRYAVPLDPTPDMIRALAVDIAIYKLCCRRDGAPDVRRTAYEDAIRLLEKIGAGKAMIPGAESAPESTSGDRASITSGTRVFSRTSLDGF